MAKQETSALRRCPVRPVGAYFPNNDRRSIGRHYPLHNNQYKHIKNKYMPIAFIIAIIA